MLYPKGTPTQPEIIAVALSKLNLTQQDVFADIGCGSGSVSLRAAREVKSVYAIDTRDESIYAANRNIRECGLKNITVLKGEAALVLPDLEVDCAFLGGSKNIGHVLAILMERVPRFVVSAVKIETAVLAIGLMEKNNKFGELLQIQISRGSELAGGTMLKPENPVFLIVGGDQC